MNDATGPASRRPSRSAASPFLFLAALAVALALAPAGYATSSSLDDRHAELPSSAGPAIADQPHTPLSEDDPDPHAEDGVDPRASSDGEATASAQKGGLLIAAVGALLLAGLTAAGIWWDRRRRLQEVRERAAQRSSAPSRRLVDTGHRACNEREAVVLMAYGWLVEHASRHGVVPREGDTLREFQHRIRTEIGVRPETLGPLFDALETRFYQPNGLDVYAERAAVLGCLEVIEEIHERAKPNVESAPGPQMDIVSPPARPKATA